MIYRFTIAGRLPGLNDMIASQGRPWWVGRKVKEDAMKLVMMALMVNNVPKFTVPVTIRVKWIERDARRDRDNVSSGGSKILLDAMQQKEILINDSRKWVSDIRHDTSIIDKDHPRIEIEIEEVV